MFFFPPLRSDAPSPLQRRQLQSPGLQRHLHFLFVPWSLRWSRPVRPLYAEVPVPPGLGRSNLCYPALFPGLFCQWPVWQGKQGNLGCAVYLLLFQQLVHTYFVFCVFPQKGERCLCSPGFMGWNCQLGLHDDNGAGHWWRVSDGNPYMPPRTGSAGVYLSPAGAMYLFGGRAAYIYL